MEPFKKLESNFILLSSEHIDTDQIIPARFLKQTHKQGLGEALFYDWRYDLDGRKKAGQVLNQKEGLGVQILVAGGNFGCGSSREHAVWALYDYGFRAVISPSISDIFKSNALKNGLLPIEVSAVYYARLLTAGDATVSIDLERQTVEVLGTEPFAFHIDPFARACLLQGVDQLGYLLAQQEAIRAFEQKREVP
ncbi:MAG: 3-isopropylmalate dehydratase small subunit [Oligoflexus sp.]|jgi:3-isopropylmalate/(R)-2-methylmalate dehydratase small subunit